MIKVKAVTEYKDLQLGRIVKQGEEIELTEKRFAELSTTNNKANMVLVARVQEKAKKDA